MDASPIAMGPRLDEIATLGWDSPPGRGLLDEVRTRIVRPLVRRSGLRGAGAAQAEATGWQAAWDALRRPTTRASANPAGMVWVAVRRAVVAEARGVGEGRRVREAGAAAWARPLSLDLALQVGWEPCASTSSDHLLGPRLDLILPALAQAGWDRAVAAEAIALLAEHTRAGVCGPARGVPRVRWRWVATRLGLPEWQVRRLSLLLVGDLTTPGLLELLVVHGRHVMEDPVVWEALRSTRRRGGASPTVLLAGWPGAATHRMDRGDRTGDPVGILPLGVGASTLGAQRPLGVDPGISMCDGERARTGDGVSSAVADAPAITSIVMTPASDRPGSSRAPGPVTSDRARPSGARPGPCTDDSER